MEAPVPTTVMDLKPIIDFLTATKERGLNRPKLRVLDVDGETELKLGLTLKGREPGSIAITRGDEYAGVVRPNGDCFGRIDEELREHLLKVAAEPAAEAKRYAVLMGRCSFCGARLQDAGSVEVGYGPVCAKNWGLPHKPKGTPKLAEMETKKSELMTYTMRL